MTASRTWDVTIRVTDRTGLSDNPEEWEWQNVLDELWDLLTVESVSATEVKVWRFGDIITEDNKPDVPFSIVDAKGLIEDERYNLSKDRGVWRLIWLDGQELV